MERRRYVYKAMPYAVLGHIFGMRKKEKEFRLISKYDDEKLKISSCSRPVHLQNTLIFEA
jgi:hypothetical protein